jgi:capsule polysaccharide modification protein KpsS
MEYIIATNKETNFIDHMCEVLGEFERDYPSSKEQIWTLRAVFEQEYMLLNALLYKQIEKYIPHEVFKAFEDLVDNMQGCVENFLEKCTVEKMMAALEAIEALNSMIHYILNIPRDLPSAPRGFKSIENADLKARFEDFNNMLKQKPNLIWPMHIILDYYRIKHRIICHSSLKNRIICHSSPKMSGILLGWD